VKWVHVTGRGQTYRSEDGRFLVKRVAEAGFYVYQWQCSDDWCDKRITPIVAGYPRGTAPMRRFRSELAAKQYAVKRAKALPCWVGLPFYRAVTVRPGREHHVHDEWFLTWEVVARRVFIACDGYPRWTDATLLKTASSAAEESAKAFATEYVYHTRDAVLVAQTTGRGGIVPPGVLRDLLRLDRDAPDGIVNDFIRDGGYHGPLVLPTQETL
jgi:hypothetical protein